MKLASSLAGVALLAFAKSAAADEPPPLPPPTSTSTPPSPPPAATTEPEPQPPVSAPVPTPPRHHGGRRETPPPFDESTFVDVTIDADKPDVWLEALTEHAGWMHIHWRWHHAVVYGRGLAWERVCVAPCTIKVPPNLRYRVAGPSVPASDDFDVGPPRGSQVLHVEAGSRGGMVAGGLAVGLGIPTAIVGVVIMASTKDNGTRDAGIITTAVGGGLIALGCVLLATNGTSVHDGSGRKIANALTTGLVF